jgi:hypothetical protein
MPRFDITKRSKTGLFIFLTAFFLYVAASPGKLPGDTGVRWSVARQIVRHGCFNLEDDFNTYNYAVGIDGKRYSFYGLGQILLFVPVTAAAFAAQSCLHLSASACDFAAQFVASSLLFPAIGAMVVYVFYRLVLLLGYNSKTAVLTSLVLAGATMLFHYSVSSQEQPQIALLLLAALAFVVKNRREPCFFYVWMIWVFFGLAVLFRLPSLMTFGPLCAVAVIDELVRSPYKFKVLAKWAAAALIGMSAFLLLIGWYNYIRFGSPLENGYALSTATSIGGHKLFESNPIYTLPAMLFSPGKSIFLYNPVLLLIPFAVPGFFKKERALTFAILAAVAGNFIFYSFFTAWAGDYAWSVRYTVDVLPLIVLPLASLLAGPIKRSKAITLGAVIAVSVLIQIASVIYNFNLEFVQNPNHSIIPDSYVWDFSQSHLVKRFENIARHIAGKQDFSSVPVQHEEPFLLKKNTNENIVKYTYSVNFFPFKAYNALHSKKLFFLLLGVWVLIAAAFFTSAARLFRRQPEELKSGHHACSRV